jgi:hypothetical protein
VQHLGAFSWVTFKYGSHISEQMKEIVEMISWPMVVKNL